MAQGTGTTSNAQVLAAWATITRGTRNASPALVAATVAAWAYAGRV
jgi:hypothetical protein